MFDFQYDPCLDGRTFLKTGMTAGAMAISYPLSKQLSAAETEAFAAGKDAEPTTLDRDSLNRLLEACLGRGGEFAEVYYERTVANSVSLDEDKISSATRGLDMGVGFRVIQGEKTGYAFSAELGPARLREAAATAAKIASGDVRRKPRELVTFAPPSYALVKISPETIAAKAKADLLTRSNAAARALDKRITQVGVYFADTTKKILIANSEGLLVEDAQTSARFGVSCAALEGGRRSMGYESKAGSLGFEHFTPALAEEFGRAAAAMAVRLLPAEDAPAGEFPVVIAAGYGGIFFHEAIGHSLEADGVRKKTSCFWDQRGKTIGSPAVSLVDDGTYKGGWGSVGVDDEGTPGQSTLLIDKGTCAGFLQDRLNAGLMQSKPTGNGRRESYQFFPIPRMTNTYLLPGQAKREDVLKSVDNGLYIARIGGGNVMPTTGQFVFSVSEGYLIEGGRITRPLKGIMLMGNGQDVLKNISLAADDLEILGGGGCGKDGQSKPVGFGNPTMKVDRITVGGQKA